MRCLRHGAFHGYGDGVRNCGMYANTEIEYNGIEKTEMTSSVSHVKDSVHMGGFGKDLCYFGRDFHIKDKDMDRK
ncbi:MAG: hypothetical protein K2P65_08080 [Lachnospiraceae bacterium]|nr:hypothetical protein [Lachnospiraceae bacterium]